MRWIIACVICLCCASHTHAVTIWGRVVDENNEPVAGPTEITVAKRDGTRIVRFTESDGSYRIEVPSGSQPIGDIIDSIRFRRADRHPVAITQVAAQLPIDPNSPNPLRTLAGGIVREDYANKVMFPRVGPLGYERNMSQLQVYEYLYYTEMGEGRTQQELRDRYAWLLLGMPRVDDMQRLPELTPVQRVMLREKRAQVYRLYGMEIPEAPTPTRVRANYCRPQPRRCSFGLFRR